MDKEIQDILVRQGLQEAPATKTVHDTAKRWALAFTALVGIARLAAIFQLADLGSDYVTAALVGSVPSLVILFFAWYVIIRVVLAVVGLVRRAVRR